MEKKANRSCERNAGRGFRGYLSSPVGSTSRWIDDAAQKKWCCPFLAALRNRRNHGRGRARVAQDVQDNTRGKTCLSIQRRHSLITFFGNDREHGRVCSSPAVSILLRKSTTSSRNSFDRSGGIHDSCAGMKRFCRSLELHTLWWRRTVCSSTEQLIFPRLVTLLHFFPDVPAFLPLFVLPFSPQIPEVRFLVVLHNLQASSP